MSIERRRFLRAAFVLSGGILLPDWLPKGRSMVVVPDIGQAVRVTYTSMLEAGFAEEFAEEFEFQATRQFQVAEIAKMFSVPVHLTGYWDDGDDGSACR